MGWSSLLLAFCGYSVLNIAQAGQKIGLQVMKTRRSRGALLWAVSLLGTFLSALINWYAVLIGSVTLVGAMAGSGLASLALFSHFVLKERIQPREILGVAVLALAAVLIGLFQQELAAADAHSRRLLLFLAAVCAAAVLLWLALRRRERAVGLVSAGFAGALGGFMPVFQKVSAAPAGRELSFLDDLLPAEHWAQGVANPYTLLWVGRSGASLLVIQFAYRHGRALRLIPAFTSCTIVVPILGGILGFGERPHPAQWAGIALVLASLLLLTWPPARAASPPGDPP